VLLYKFGQCEEHLDPINVKVVEGEGGHKVVQAVLREGLRDWEV